MCLFTSWIIITDYERGQNGEEIIVVRQPFKCNFPHRGRKAVGRLKVSTNKISNDDETYAIQSERSHNLREYEYEARPTAQGTLLLEGQIRQSGNKSAYMETEVTRAKLFVSRDKTGLLKTKSNKLTSFLACKDHNLTQAATKAPLEYLNIYAAIFRGPNLFFTILMIAETFLRQKTDTLRNLAAIQKGSALHTVSGCVKSSRLERGRGEKHCQSTWLTVHKAHSLFRVVMIHKLQHFINTYQNLSLNVLANLVNLSTFISLEKAFLLLVNFNVMLTTIYTFTLLNRPLCSVATSSNMPLQKSPVIWNSFLLVSGTEFNLLLELWLPVCDRPPWNKEEGFSSQTNERVNHKFSIIKYLFSISSISVFPKSPLVSKKIALYF
ncbi:hypothetical protein EGR_07649 [Echinococcus granulosus]|uniref:Uncharacterized protein n=1 Tax=Echinococcus granulosus TaxID=6210 RepID=W6UVM8_ECHGR|nr:hypothetical protein EGR_07649 [Echinococcus granulosus]EUB57484.1 hypothetical protein EGR_07649 [Echinococcus granulosus]